MSRLALRPGVLDGLAIGLSGEVPTALGAELSRLGAQLVSAPAQDAGLAALVVDASGAFAGGGTAGLRAALDETWDAVLAVAEGLIAQGSGAAVILIAPVPAAGELAGAARAGLENLARTLSVEWARHAITAVAVLPGDATSAETLSDVVAYLLSPAGAYFSGCRMELDSLAAS